jgi:hypothetical protein
MKTVLKAPGTVRLKLKYDDLLSSFAFKVNVRRFTKEEARAAEARAAAAAAVGRCRLTLSNPS